MQFLPIDTDRGYRLLLLTYDSHTLAYFSIALTNVFFIPNGSYYLSYSLSLVAYLIRVKLSLRRDYTDTKMLVENNDNLMTTNLL